ncbi:MAG: aminotransferase class V-fold PLP-dependent enzyme [Bacteroidetes bacterium]|nr:aminotransferase class V-fold PLP-dependent enzyme [Bacteroidota bacterium]
MITCQKEEFFLPEDVTYLNCAYMAPGLKVAEKAGIEGIKRKRLPFNIHEKDFFEPAEELRKVFSHLINCREPKRIVIIPSVSYGIANAIKNIKIGKGENVIITSEQFPSNVYPWIKLCEESGATLNTIHPPQDLSNRGEVWNQKLLEAINQRTKVVAISQTHWTDGTLFDLSSIRKRTIETNSLLIVDGTQSVGAYPFDLQEIQPDVLVCAGYKWLLGPYSIGLAYYGTQFDNGKPLEESWINRKESHDFAKLVNYRDQYQPLSLRYEVGEHSNFILVPMMLAALTKLAEWNPVQIQNYCQSLSNEAINKLRNKGFHVENEPHRANHLWGIKHPKLDDLKFLRSSLEATKVYVSIRGSAIRVSVNVFNDKSDLDKLVKTLIASVNATKQ